MYRDDIPLKSTNYYFNSLVVFTYVCIWVTYHIFGHDSIYAVGHLLPLLLVFTLFQPFPSTNIHLSKFELLSGTVISLLFVAFSLNLLIYNQFYFLGFIPVISYLVAVGLLRSNLKSSFWDLWTLLFSGFGLISVFVFGRGTNEVLVVGSRNVVASIIFFFVAMGWIFRIINEENLGLLGLFSTLASILTLVLITGRSGLVIAVGLLFLLLYEQKQKKRILLYILPVLTLLSMAAVLFNQLQSIHVLIDRGLQSKRWQMWHSLFQAMELQHVLIGFTPEWGKALMYDRGSHNSFIRFLRAYGILGPTLLAAGFLYILRKNFEIHNGIVILATLLLFRINFDQHLMMPFLGVTFWIMLLHNEGL